MAADLSLTTNENRDASLDWRVTVIRSCYSIILIHAVGARWAV